MSDPAVAAFLANATNERQQRLDALTAVIADKQAELDALKVDAADLRLQVAKLGAWAKGIADGTIVSPKI